MNERQSHWDEVYGTRQPDNVSWYSPHLDQSLAFIEKAACGAQARIIDVGAGASTLVDDLLAAGYQNVSAMDLSERALRASKRRLGELASKVTWHVGDVTKSRLPADSIDVWHDRAVFHFLTEPAERRDYVEHVMHAVRPGGHVIVATFGLKGPEKCSGLDVARYDADGLHAEFGRDFVKLASATEIHRTPWATDQQFLYCFCRRT